MKYRRWNNLFSEELTKKLIMAVGEREMFAQGEEEMKNAVSGAFYCVLKPADRTL